MEVVKMIITIPLTELRPNLPKVMDRISKYFDRCIVTRRGKPEAVILAEEDYESLLDTLDILSDQKLIKDIKKAEQDLRTGKGIPWDKVKNKLGYAV